VRGVNDAPSMGGSFKDWMDIQILG
jgi:hypothetical protein